MALSRFPRLLLPATLALLALPLCGADAQKKPDKFLRATPPGAAVRVNSVGFEPADPKRATVAQNATSFKIIEIATSDVVLQGTLSEPVATAITDTNETVRTLDFSTLQRPGRYLIEVDGGARSAPFEVAQNIWNKPYVAVLRGVHLWRCGTELHAKWEGGEYHQDACHLSDGGLDYVGGPKGAIKPSTKGWHDAGDYNKYIVNAGVSVGLMWKAWEQFRSHIEPMQHGIPESGKGMPDLLAELRWEYDWMFTMQFEDGKVSHKLSSPDFRYWGKPDGEKDQRYYTPWSSYATADFIAMMALGAKHFREFDPAYADRCLAAARLSWACLKAHPNLVEPNLEGFRTGAYMCGDKDPRHRLWAALEMYEATGETEFLKDFETRAANEDFQWGGPNWGDPGDIGLCTYLVSSRPEARDAALVGRLRAKLLDITGRIVASAKANPHARPYGVDRNRWYWGCNGAVASQTLLLHTADKLAPSPAYRETALDALAHLFGRNYHGRSYVTGLGFNPPAHTHDRRGTPQIPGYLIGGAWPTHREWFDELAAYEHNEIALNWNASLIYALAPFVEPAADTAK